MRSSKRASSPLLASPGSKPRASRVVRRLRRNEVSSSTSSIFPCDWSNSALLSCARERQEECCALRCITLKPHSSAVRVGDSFGDRQADAGSRCLMLRTWGPIKAFEYSRPLFWGDKRSFILHAEDDFSIG